MITTKTKRMSFSSLNSTTFTLTTIGYVLYFLVRHDWYVAALYPLSLAVFIINVFLLVYSLLLIKYETSSTSNLKRQAIFVYLKLVSNLGFITLMLI